MAQCQTLFHLAQKYGIKLDIVEDDPDRDYWGYALRPNRIVLVDQGSAWGPMIQTFFHELGHIYCYKHGLWPAYHRDARKTNARAEKWVDRWAASKYNSEPYLKSLYGEYVGAWS